VKAIQEAKGSRAPMPCQERGGWRTEIDDQLAAFVAEANSMYLATPAPTPALHPHAKAKGFVKVLDKTSWRRPIQRNRQYLREQLSENPKALLFS